MQKFLVPYQTPEGEKRGKWVVANNKWEAKRIVQAMQASDPTIEEVVEDWHVWLSPLNVDPGILPSGVELPEASECFLWFCRSATDQLLEKVLATEYRESLTDETHLPDYNAAVQDAERRGWIVRNGQRV
jgi:hypothetical protein